MAQVRWLDADEQRVWRQFVWGTRRLFDALDRQLQRDSGMPHTYYLILSMLSEAPDRTLTMGQLAQVVDSSPSRLSHAVARLEEHGWVRRTKHSSDRRTTLAHLTDDGFDALQAAAPGHMATVRRFMFDKLTPQQLRVLGEVFGNVHKGLDREVGGEPSAGAAPHDHPLA